MLQTSRVVGTSRTRLSFRSHRGYLRSGAGQLDVLAGFRNSGSEGVYVFVCLTSSYHKLATFGQIYEFKS